MCFSLRYIPHGILFLALGRSAAVYEPWAPPRVVVESCDPLHLKLELVESQGELLCVGVKEGPGQSVGSWIEICIGSIDGPPCILPHWVKLGPVPWGSVLTLPALPLAPVGWLRRTGE